MIALGGLAGRPADEKRTGKKSRERLPLDQFTIDPAGGMSERGEQPFTELRVGKLHGIERLAAQRLLLRKGRARPHRIPDGPAAELRDGGMLGRRFDSLWSEPAAKQQKTVAERPVMGLSGRPALKNFFLDFG